MSRFLRRFGAATLASAIAVAGLVATAPAANAATASVRINEANTHGTDFIEVTNIGDTVVDISGFIVKDDNDTRTDAFPAGSVLTPGAFVAIEPSFGLGAADEARLFLPDGETQIDGTSWAAHPPAGATWGRCPDGTGEFIATAAATPGAANACTVPAAQAIVLNEVVSDGGDPDDWIELKNTATVPVDVSGLVLGDASPANRYVLPAGMSIAAGGYLVLDRATFGFGLGSDDAARLFDLDGTTLIDEFTWTSHAPTSLGRCPDGSGPFVRTAATTKGAPNDCTPPDAAGAVVINEVESNGDSTDWVELFNTGDTAVDLTGYRFVDNDASRTPYVLPAGSRIEPGGFFVIDQADDGFPFGLGNADSAIVSDPDGALIDEFHWTSHAPVTYGRCPDGTGAMTSTTTSTKGAPNDCTSPIRINEVVSSGGEPGDWVELTNIGWDTVDVSGFVLSDADPTHRYVLPAGTEIAPGAFLVIDEAVAGGPGFDFGLGGNDSVVIATATGDVADRFSWQSHAATSFGRCPDGVGAFEATVAPTKGAPNRCAGVAPILPWPGGDDLTVLDAPNTYAGDMSGIDYEPSGTAAPGTLWAVENGNGLLYRIVAGTDGAWTPDPADGWAAGKTLRYPDGTGVVDAEGVTVAGDDSAGGVYVASERDNDASAVSRPSVLRYDVSGSPAGAADELVATTEWNLAADFPGLPANGGLEGVTWIPDAFLVAGGFLDERTGGVYDPADYPGHGTGLFFVGVEDTAGVYAYALADDGGFTRIAAIETSFAVVADVQFDADTAWLWVVCDDACAGRTAPYTLVDGVFAETVQFAAPANSDPGLAHEGFAVADAATCVDGVRATFYTDDANTGGHSLRGGTLPCPDRPVTPIDPVDPADPGTPEVPGTPGAPGAVPPAVPDERLTDATRNAITAPTTVVPGETITITVGVAYAGQTVHVYVHSTPRLLGSPVVAPDGTVRVTIPVDLAAGSHRLVVLDGAGAVIGWQDIVIAETATDAAATGGRGGTLATTGSTFAVGATLAGALLLLLAGGAIATRRRLS